MPEKMFSVGQKVFFCELTGEGMKNTILANTRIKLMSYTGNS